MLNNRAKFFPSVPVVHMGVDGWFLKTKQPVPVDVVGVPVEYDFLGTIEQALKWHPDATRLVVVTGASAPDLEVEAPLRELAKRFDGRVTFDFLAGLPTSAVLERLGELDSDAVVFTPRLLRGWRGPQLRPREAARKMAAASSAPVYGPYNTFIGMGIVGGAMPSFEAMGREAGSIVNRLLAGAAPASLRLPQVMPTTLNVDWRQVRRWGIDENAIPPDTVVHFRTPTFWEAYRIEALTAIAIFVLQSGLVAGLLVERRRRRGAELAVDKHRFELAHASRLAIAGELTASIAHEINQPLGAILSNVNAAELMLGSGTNDLDEVRQILGDIHADNLRASEVIRRLRTLLAKHEVERRLIDLNDSLADMATILRAEAQRRRVTLAIRPELPAVEVLADRIQVQQSIAQPCAQRHGCGERRAGGTPNGDGVCRAARGSGRDHGARPRTRHRRRASSEALRFIFQHQAHRYRAGPVDCAYARRGAGWQSLGRERTGGRCDLPCRPASRRVPLPP